MLKRPMNKDVRHIIRVSDLDRTRRRLHNRHREVLWRASEAAPALATHLTETESSRGRRIPPRFGLASDTRKRFKSEAGKK